MNRTGWDYLGWYGPTALAFLVILLTWLFGWGTGGGERGGGQEGQGTDEEHALYLIGAAIIGLLTLPFLLSISGAIK